MSNLSPQTAATALQQELQVVQQELEQALADLYSPLADLARTNLQRAQPLTRAAFVLSIGVGDPDDAILRQRRLSLAAAQEMLFIALTIHKLLLRPQAAQQDEQQKTIMGGIILTGDYCFTRSAIMAAQTDQIEVVELFSQALKAISEGLLRNFFAQRNPTQPASNEQTARYDEQGDLFVSGAQSAAILADLPLSTTADLVDLAHTLTQQATLLDLPTITAKVQAVRQLTVLQQARLAAFLDWLAANANGSDPTGVQA